jgi:UDP-glucose 4-epimerase
VGDVVRAWLSAAEDDATGAFNVSTGTETSLLELAAELRLEFDHAAGRAGEVMRSCLEPGAAAAQFGWKAEVSLEEGLAETLGALRGASRGYPAARG